MAGSFIIVRSFCYIRTHPFLVVWYFCSVPLSVVVVVVAFAGWCRCSSYYCYYYHHLRVQTGVLICTLYLLVDIGTIQNLFCSIFQAGFFFLLSFVYSRCFTWHFLFSFFFFVFFFFFVMYVLPRWSMYMFFSFSGLEFIIYMHTSSCIYYSTFFAWYIQCIYSYTCIYIHARAFICVVI